ncbi:hypothetical protein G8O24_21555 [Bradyrhizobium sp. INPA01-394B]|uniref:DUF4102 domain-containing protein n=1 Tax=Bradyrhizobium campsiandrae TaxID=1729892 RepID=A0ABR7U518_9BRAD|nr:hypothetical protein [Bradyrhizobium campsiandrae]MBC9879931.1 hypothetical protein [Bradyrhizobium campsiandrae]MBC9978616.1 hypothetical protein [Bradyrhizobium campsiandrae]
MVNDLDKLLEEGGRRPAPLLKLVLRPERGSRRKPRGFWHIIDGARSISTGCSTTQSQAAERALSLYEVKKTREMLKRRRSRNMR